MLIGKDVELVELALLLVEFCRIEVRDAERSESGSLAGIVGDLIIAIRNPAHEGEAALRVEQGGEIEESFLLRGVVVDGVIGRRRIFDADAAAEITSGHEILGLADRAAIFSRCREGAVAAAIDADATAVVEGVGLGLDVEHAGGAQAVLGRQRAGNQRHAADDSGVDDLSESADAVRQHDAVDAILQVGVLVADVQVAARSRILRYARSLQQRLVERRIGALRQRFQTLLAHLVGAGAGRRVQIVTNLVQLVILAGNHLLRRLLWLLRPLWCRRSRWRDAALAAGGGRHARSRLVRRLHALGRGDIHVRKRGRCTS